MYFVYVIINLKKRKYIGQTNNIYQRLEMHNNLDFQKAKFHRTTYKKGPWKVLFKKNFNTRLEAIKFEKFLKTGNGRDWLERTRLGE